MMNIDEVPEYLNNIVVVLSRTSHPGNIGSAARAMKTMGLSRLVLVAPNLMQTPITTNPPVFHADAVEDFQLPEESFILASGAKDILEQASVVSTLQEALSQSAISCALTSRQRELSAPVQTPRQLAPYLLQVAQSGQQVALVFGNETYGLSIEEVGLCNRLMTISGNPNYFSLNLAQAVQVITYELFSHVQMAIPDQNDAHLATHQQVMGMIEHYHDVMEQVGFFNKRNEQRLMRRVSALFQRASLSKEDVDVLRGFLSTTSKRLVR